MRPKRKINYINTEIFKQSCLNNTTKKQEYKSSLNNFRYCPMSFKKEFWNQKILSWEKNKYKTTIKAFDVNSSVKRRLHLASNLLHQFSEGKNVLELGCAGGMLWNRINSLKLKSYKGVDFSETAIEAFQNKIQNFKNKDKVSLFCEDCGKNIYSTDIVVSLGLLDWLSMEKIRIIAENYRNCWYLHSFSEKRLTFSQMAHSLYSLINYNYTNYSPKYRKANELLSAFGPKARIYRDSELSFGAFIYHLPLGVEFKCHTDFV